MYVNTQISNQELQQLTREALAAEVPATELVKQTALLRMHADYCKAVANEHRLAILYLLSERELSVGDLARELDLSVHNVSQHLRVLKERGIVVDHRDGQTVYYASASPKLVAACHLIREALIEQHVARGTVLLGGPGPGAKTDDDHVSDDLETPQP